LALLIIEAGTGFEEYARMPNEQALLRINVAGDAEERLPWDQRLSIIEYRYLLNLKRVSCRYSSEEDWCVDQWW